MYIAQIATKKTKRISKTVETKSLAMAKLFLLQNVKEYQFGVVVDLENLDPSGYNEMVFVVTGSGNFPKVDYDASKANRAV